jgi:hypothetical protein
MALPPIAEKNYNAIHHAAEFGRSTCNPTVRFVAARISSMSTFEILQKENRATMKKETTI